jgi:hypothetical protein
MVISEATTADFDAIVNLFAAHEFALKRRDWFDWKHKLNPCGNSVVLKGEEDGKLVATASIVPQCFEYRGEIITALQAVDGFIVPEMRGRRLFSRVPEAILDYRPESSAEKYFYISFANVKNSRRALESAGWSLLGEFHARMYILHPEKLRSLPGGGLLRSGLAIPWCLYRFALFRGTGDFTIKPLSGEQISLDQFRMPDKISGTRSSRFLDWRVKTHPYDRIESFAVFRKGEIAGYVISSDRGKSHIVLEWRFRHSPQECLATYLRFLYETRQASSVTFLQFGGPEIGDKLPALGIDRGNTGGAVYVHGIEKAGLPSDPKHWAITYVDSDW